MARRLSEQGTIDRFTVYLAQTTGRDWRPSADELSTFKNTRNYDCEFTSPGSVPIAADISALFPIGSNQEDQAKRARLNARLVSELRKLGIGGLFIKTPPIQKKHAHPNWSVSAAAKIRDALALSQGTSEIEVEGCRIERIADDSNPSFFYHSQFSTVQPIPGAGHALAALLRDKHEQLDVDGHQRWLIVVNAGNRASAIDVRDACAFINFHEYPNFDRIYFEESPGMFHLVYDCQAWYAMESRLLPNEDEARALVAAWFEIRLSGNWPGALEAVLQILCNGHGYAWLTEAGRELLEMEAHLFLQNCEWETPRALWEIFRGPLPIIRDARRKALPIVPQN